MSQKVLCINNMEHQPNEILEYVFEQLFSIKDVQKCAKTCVRWNKIVKNKFKYWGNVFVADGALDSGLANANVELLDLLRPQNNHVFHVERMEKGLSYGICGGLVQNQPMILGSFPVSPCDEPKTDGLIFGTSGQPNLTFQEDSWFNYDASSIVLNHNSLWLTGGCDSQDELNPGVNTTKFFSLDKPPQKGPNLPFGVSSHAMVQVSSKAIYLIGGFQDDIIANKTWIIDPTNNFKVKQGPSLNEDRILHSCGKLMLNNKVYIVVAGGQSTGSDGDGLSFDGTNSVEILDTSLPGQKWIKGPNLPFKLFYSAMVNSPIGKGVVLIGGETICHLNDDDFKKQFSRSNALIELSGDSIDTLEWKILDQKLKFKRSHHVAFSIPDTVYNELVSIYDQNTTL